MGSRRGRMASIMAIGSALFGGFAQEHPDLNTRSIKDFAANPWKGHGGHSSFYGEGTRKVTDKQRRSRRRMQKHSRKMNR